MSAKKKKKKKRSRAKSGGERVRAVSPASATGTESRGGKRAVKAASPAPRRVGSADFSRMLLWTAVGLAVLYTAVMSYFCIIQHFAFRTQMADLGHVMQALWSATQGDWAMTNYSTGLGEARSRLGMHANFFYYLLVPFYFIYTHAATLLVLTSVACGAAGLGLFFLARHRLGDTWWSLVPPAAFYLSPIVHDANLYDFHIITFTTAFVVWMVWACETGRVKWMWFFLTAAMLCKEDVPLITAMFGVYLVLTQRKKLGIQVIAVSAAYLVITQKLVIPLVDVDEQVEMVAGKAARHKWLGASPGEMVMTIVTEPVRVISYALEWFHIRLPIYLLLCGGLAGLRAWRILLLITPFLGIAMLSQGGWLTRVTGTYYWIVAEAVVIISCILSASMRRPMAARPWQLTYLGAATVVFSFLFSPLPHGFYASWGNYAPVKEAELLPEIKEKIPDEGWICVQKNLGPHLAHRRDISYWNKPCARAVAHLYFMRHVGGPAYGFFIRDTMLIYHGVKRRNGRIEALLKSPGWGLTYQKEGFYLFQKGAPSVIGREEAWERFRKDLARFDRDVKKSRRFEVPFHRYLTKG
jgi:uncharacterized membrane protein